MSELHSPAFVEHVTTSLDIGGAQAMLVKLMASAAPPRGNVDGRWSAGVLSLMAPGIMAAPLREAGCPIYTLGLKPGLPGPKALLGLQRITSSIAPDILQGWMYHGNLAASVAGFMQSRSIPVVWNVRHSLADPAVEKGATRRILSLSARLSRHTAGIIYNSRTAAREHESIGFSAERTICIPNGFDTNRYRPDRAKRALLGRLFGVAANVPVVAMVARGHPMKDHATLVRAMAEVRRTGRDAHLLIVGPEIDRPGSALAAMVATALPRNRATLIGERTDVADWLPGVDILALSSAWGEAFPNILGEAMACGVPCVATAVGDSGWIIGDGGLSVPPRDHEAMAAALSCLIDAGEEGRGAIGSAGRARIVSEFDLARIVRRYRDVYAAILGERQMPADCALDRAVAMTS